MLVAQSYVNDEKWFSKQFLFYNIILFYFLLNYLFNNGIYEQNIHKKCF